jgi:hypothetical protein
MLADETCWFLAADFDKPTWREDAAAFLAACKARGVPAALERSRAGGSHFAAMVVDSPRISPSPARQGNQAVAVPNIGGAHMYGCAVTLERCREELRRRRPT